MDLKTGLAAAKGAFDVVKGVLDMTRHPQFDISLVQGKLLELQSLIIDAQSALGEAYVENHELRQQLNERDAKLTIANDLETHDGGYYTRKSESGKPLYCPICWGSNEKLVPLTPYRNPGEFKCYLHNAGFATPEYYEWKKQQYPPQPKRINLGSQGWMGS